MKNIILDTDMDTDCDDAGALAVLHNLQSMGLCTIQAVICDAPVKDSSLCARAINAFFKRPSIPTGRIEISHGAREFSLYFEHRARCEAQHLLYSEIVAQRHSGLIARTKPSMNAVKLYRKILSRAEDNSIIICAIGMLNVLSDLMDSSSCSYSPLNGKTLVARKVDKLVVMGKGIFPHGKDTFNWMMAPLAASNILSNWPGHLVISPEGEDVLTGRELLADVGNNPVADAYRIFLRNGGLRPSWDPVAVLYSVQGCTDLFRLRNGYVINYDAASGLHQWERDSQRRVSLLEVKGDKQQIAAIIEKLMFPPCRQAVAVSL